MVGENADHKLFKYWWVSWFDGKLVDWLVMIWRVSSTMIVMMMMVMIWRATSPMMGDRVKGSRAVRRRPNIRLSRASYSQVPTIQTHFF